MSSRSHGRRSQKRPSKRIPLHCTANRPLKRHRQTHQGGNTIKIAIISTPIFPVFPPTYGGTELVAGLIAEEMAKNNHDVTLYAPNGSNVKDCNIVEVGEPQNPSIANWLDLEKALIKKIEHQLKDFDIIHDHNLFGVVYNTKLNNPSLKIVHTHHTGLMSNWTKNKPFKLNTIAISDWMKNAYERQGIPTRRVYNGIKINNYPIQTEKSDRFLWLSRIAFFKAPHKAIEIAKKTGIKLNIAGCTSFAEDQKYIEQIKKSCDGEQIRFIGEVTNQEKINLMQNAKALIVTAKWGEPFGLHAIEAMACGTGVLAIADGGLKETVKEGGILCEDHYELAETVRRYKLIEPKKCRKNASLFSSKKMRAAYEKLYNQIISGNEW